MAVTKNYWGFHNGYEIYLYTITNKHGNNVKITNFGATLVGIEVPDKDGNLGDVVMGYDNFDGYLNGKTYQGAFVGRYANRIDKATYSIGGKQYHLERNDATNCLHSGSDGFNRRVFAGIISGENSVTFKYFSPDGDCHFNGNMEVAVKYIWTDNNELEIEYKAVCDEDTIYNPTNHAYFTLSGQTGYAVYDTELTIFAEKYTPVNEILIPVWVSSVDDTVFDFRKPKKIGTDIINSKSDGYDHNFILGDTREYRKAAHCYDTLSGREMTCYTDLPAIQLYTGNSLYETGKNGVHFGKHSAFCLETQYSPNTPNEPSYPSCVIKKGEEFVSKTVYAFGVK